MWEEGMISASLKLMVGYLSIQYVNLVKYN